MTTPLSPAPAPTPADPDNPCLHERFAALAFTGPMVSIDQTVLRAPLRPSTDDALAQPGRPR